MKPKPGTIVYMTTDECLIKGIRAREVALAINFHEIETKGDRKRGLLNRVFFTTLEAAKADAEKRRQRAIKKQQEAMGKPRIRSNPEKLDACKMEIERLTALEF